MTRSAALALPDDEPDPSLLGRLYLILLAALRQPIISADDALLADEQDGPRKGNCKMVGRAFALAHQRGWIVPVSPHPIRRTSIKSGRRRRARGLIELWTRTPDTAKAFERVKRLLTKRPAQRTLFD
jgi:hypothetical protein